MYDPLFMALAQAESQPSHGFRDFQAAAGAASAPLEGYMQTRQALQGLAAQKAQILDAFGKLSDSVGYNRASQMFAPIFKASGVAPVAPRNAPAMGPSSMATPSPTPTPQVNPAVANAPQIASASMTPSIGGGDTSIPTPQPPPSAQGGQDFGATVNDMVQNPDNYGKGEIERTKNIEGLQTGAPASFGYVRSFFTGAGRPEIGEGLIQAAQSQGQNYVPKDIFDKASGLVGPRNEIADALKQRTQLQIDNSINQHVNALISHGALGQTGQNNLRIARLKSLLQRADPITPDEINTIIKPDLTAIATGGVPLKDTVEGAQVNTISTKFATILQAALNDPQTFNDSGFRQRAVRLANEFVEADNAVQNKAYNLLRVTHGELLTPKKWDQIKYAVENNEQLPIYDISGGGTPGAGGGITGFELPGGSTGDPEADMAIQTIMGSQLPDAAKRARVAAARARAVPLGH